jgi:hypothetical protein
MRPLTHFRETKAYTEGVEWRVKIYKERSRHFKGFLLTEGANPIGLMRTQPRLSQKRI